LARSQNDALVGSVYRRWHKEIFADLAALLLGGPAASWGMMDFLAHPSPKTLTYKPGGAHPTGYLRALILAEMLNRMGFGDDAERVRSVWRGLYRPDRGHRIPERLLGSSKSIIPHVVDEIAFQTRRALAQRALADVIPFTHADQRAILSGARALAAQRVPTDLPPRFLVSGSHYALRRGGQPRVLSNLVTRHLADPAIAERESGLFSLAAA
jgi:hypothetical protein